MSSPLYKKQLIQQVIRVNHAGEYAARRIYDTQALVFKGDKRFYDMLCHMKEQEQHHLDYFTEALSKYQVEETKFLPIWSFAAAALGFGTAIMGKKAAMACTVAVEDVISDHYQEQIEQLEDSPMKEAIKKFRQEEIEHHDTGIENQAEQAFGYKALSGAIKLGCKIAIFLSKKM